MLNLWKGKKKLLNSCLGMLVLSTVYSNSIEAANWTAPVNISAPDKDAVAPQVIIGTDKKCVAVWSRFNGTNFAVQSSQTKVGGAWSKPATLSKLVGNAYYAKLALNQQDNPIVVWAQKKGSTFVIQTTELAEKGWLVPVTLSIPGGADNIATKPQIAISDKGNIVVVWQRNDGVNNIIQAVTRNNNRSWSHPDDLTVSVPEGLGDIDPQVAIDAKGNAIAVWVHTPTQTVQASVKTQNGPWSLPSILSDAGETVSQPQVAFDAFGKAIVVWTRYDGTNRIIQSTSCNSNGNWASPVDLSESGQDAVNPQLAIDSGGNAFVVWQRSDGVHTIIQAATKQGGRTSQDWSPATDLSLPGEDASDPKISINANRLVGVIWKRSDGANFIIQVTTKVPGNPWAPPVSISAPGQDATSPNIALDNFDNIVATWQRTDGQNTIIQSSFGLSNKK